MGRHVETLEFTTTGYVEVIGPDGQVISRHLRVDEARESAIRHAISRTDSGDFVYRFTSPETRMSVRLLAPAGGNAPDTDIIPPNPPAGGQLGSFTANSVVVSWTNDSANDISFTRVYKSTTSADTGFGLIGTVEYPGTTYTDTSYSPTQAAWYRLTHTDNSGNQSSFSATFRDTTAPSAPGTPTVTGYTSSTITLSLPTSSAADHASYTIQTSTDGSNWSNRATNVTAATWQDTGLSASTIYRYRLVDVDISGNSSIAGSSVSQTTEPAVTGDNATRITTLLAGRSPHFSYSSYVPADPVTTSEVTVTSATQFNQYSDAGSGGVRIIVNTSFSGTVRITRNDIDVVMSNGATITGDVELGTGSVYRASRIRWTGGNVNGRFLGRQFQDVLFDDFNLNSGSNYNDLTANANRFDRIAFLNTTFQNSPPSGSGTSWVLYNQQIYSGPLHTGFFWLNSKAISTALHAWRVMSIDGILICDSAFNPTGTATSTGMRIHLRSTNVWVKDSWIRGIVHTAGVDTASGDSVPQITNGLFDNFDRYVTTDNSWYSVTNAPFTEAEIRNSRMYSTAGAGAYVYPTGGFTNGGGNDKVAWDGSTLPDYSIIGAVR